MVHNRKYIGKHTKNRKTAINATKGGTARYNYPGSASNTSPFNPPSPVVNTARHKKAVGLCAFCGGPRYSSTNGWTRWFKMMMDANWNATGAARLLKRDRGDQVSGFVAAVDSSACSDCTTTIYELSAIHILIMEELYDLYDPSFKLPRDNDLKIPVILEACEEWKRANPMKYKELIRNHMIDLL